MQRSKPGLHTPLAAPPSPAPATPRAGSTAQRRPGANPTVAWALSTETAGKREAAPATWKSHIALGLPRNYRSTGPGCFTMREKRRLGWGGVRWGRVGCGEGHACVFDYFFALNAHYFISSSLRENIYLTVHQTTESVF